jgi:hypothetical protein
MELTSLFTCTSLGFHLWLSTYFYECTQIVLDVCDLQMTPSVFVVSEAFVVKQADLQVALSVPFSKRVSYLEWIPYLWLIFNTKQFTNGLAKRKNLFYWYLSNLLKIIYCPNHCVTIIKHIILSVFCILIPHLSKFWKSKIETTKPRFLN